MAMRDLEEVFRRWEALEEGECGEKERGKRIAHFPGSCARDYQVLKSVL